MKIECPGCKLEFEVTPMSILPKEDVIYLNFKTKSELLDAKTVGKLIENMDRLQRAIGEDFGAKVAVFIKSIEYVPPEMTIGFLVTQIRKEK